MADKSFKKPLRSQTRATIAPPENIEEEEVEQEISNNPEIQEEIMPPPTSEIQNLSLNESVQVFTTQKMPSLLAITAEAVKAYEAVTRSWMATSHGAPIQRSAWPRNVRARITVDWLGSYQASINGNDWMNIQNVPEETFLSFLQETYVKGKDNLDFKHTPIEKFEEEVARPIQVDTADPEIFIRRYAELLEEYDKLKENNYQFSDTLEKRLMEIAERSIRVNGSKELAQKWLRRVYGGKERPMKLMEFFQDIKTYNNLCAKYYKFVLEEFPKHSMQKKRPLEANKEDSLPTSQLKKKPKCAEKGSREACWICGNPHKGDCRFKGKSWSNQENTHWAASQVGKDYAKVGWRSCPPTLEAGKHPPVKKGESFLSTLHMPHIFGSLSVNSQEQPKVDVGIISVRPKPYK
jgi:hypothetical protein